MNKTRTTQERLGQSPQRLVRYFALVMGVVYVSIGIALWVMADRALSGVLQMGATPRRILGSVFIIYGTVRLVRLFQSNPQQPSDHE